MGFFDRFFDSERLPSLPKTARIADVEALHVRTAGGMVILSCDVAGATALIDACTAKEPVQLRGPGRNATFVPVTRLKKIVLDPNQGWIIPLAPEAVATLASISSSPGEHVLGTFAVVVE